MLRSAGHETYHFVEHYSANDAADLRDYVIDSLKGNGVDIEKALEKYEKQGYATRDEQISEVVVDSMFDVFSNEDFIKNLTAKNQTLAKRLANHIGELVQKIRDAVKMLSFRYNNPEIKALFFPNVLAIARRVVDQCTEKDSSAYDDAKEIRDVIKETPIYISPEMKNEIISQFVSYLFSSVIISTCFVKYST